MGVEFVIMGALKLCAMGGVGIATVTGLQYFLNFEFKSKKKGGEEGGSKASESLRERAGQIG